MDWELKATGWDFSVMGTEDDHDPRLATFVGSSRLISNNGGDFSVDLQLGRLADVSDEKGKGQKGTFNVTSPSKSSKRARTISGAQNVTCIVDGCVADLSGCREYHRRHRVCERHSKTPVVSVAGKEQRFCQQCSRFQSLSEFDEEKRSCRKRLDGHNRRRRKPQPEALYMNHQGPRLLHFSCPEAYTTSPAHAWPSVPKHPISHHTPTFLNTSVTAYNGGDKRFPFLLVNEPERSNNHQAAPEVTYHAHLASVNPHRVHSLLSSPYPIPTGLDFGCPAHQSVLVPPDSTHRNTCNGNEVTVVSLSPDDLLEKGASQVLPFSWK